MIRIKEVALLVSLLFFKVIYCSSDNYRERIILEVDVIRNIYFRLERSLWESTVNNPMITRDDQLMTIFNGHNDFVNNYLRNFLDVDDLKTLIKLYGWQSLNTESVSVNRMFIRFQQHLTRETKFIANGTFNDEISLDLVEHVLDDSNWPLMEALDNLHEAFTKHRLFYSDILNLTKTSCILQRSPQQVIHQMYNVIVATQLQAYMMMQFSYMLLNVYKKGDFFKISSRLRTNFEMKTVQSLESAFEISIESSRALWRCDPDKFEESTTFHQITRLLQGHLENEKDLNQGRTCVDECETYQFTEEFGCSEKSICNRQPKCKGKLLFCKTLSDDMWVCPGDKKSLRRYEFIEYDDGEVLGKKGFCPNQGFKLDRWWLYMIIYRCDHCFCICDEQGKLSDRFFSLRPAVSDTRNNMVVTGIRFVKSNRIIHLQIQESQLMKYGKVSSINTRWVPIQEFGIFDKGIRDGIDYHTLAYDRREVDLDDLIAPIGHVVTGVKLRRLGNHLNLEIRVSEIDFSSGLVMEPEKSFWISNDNTQFSQGKEKRKEISMYLPDVPTKTRFKSVPKSSSNTFIKFTFSDIYKDAAQTTVPFLDSQDVTSSPATPLQGVGLLYKGQRGFGGFITPKIETIDISSYIRANMQNFKTVNERNANKFNYVSN
ncbi:CLUMA_CG015288, isoform A [Clunio marinus]|uniref:CLUMA_CG015288, isoform A n=1 Tax=Clunio marinus TaxID=568069 RepID=A0A1J1IQZ5_9DIPT|nr:CLUMA_CG015288, isoform A [Clunio marinus]